MKRANNVGIVAMTQYFPKLKVSQSALEKFDGVSPGKYVKGLGQDAMAFTGDREDIASMMLTATSSLLERYDIDPSKVGRLEVGTETIIDKSKSIKSVLMQLFGDNSNIEAVDTINACYGGTAALLNSTAWMESSAWDGRYAMVVTGDIAVYEPGPARPTGGAGVTAMLIGPEAPIQFDQFRGSHFENAYDFYKPNLESEFPVVDGKLSISCYYRAIDRCAAIYQKRFQETYKEKFDLNTSTKYALFHSPFTKLVKKSFARLYQNEFLEGADRFPGVDSKLRSLSKENTYSDSKFQKLFCDLTEDLYQKRVEPSLLLSRQLGNSYTGSLYGSLASLITCAPAEEIKDQRALMFSYGSGAAATMFSLKFPGDLSQIKENLDLNATLDARREADPKEYTEMMDLRAKNHSKVGQPEQGTGDLFPKTFYLDEIDELKRRKYKRMD